MRKYICSGILLFSLTVLSFNVCAAPSSLIKIGLIWGQTEIKLTLNDQDRIYDLSGPGPVALATPGDGQSVFAFSGDEITLNGAPAGKGPLRIVPAATFLTWNTRIYRGEFLIFAREGRLTLINQIQLEDYLRGVLPKEVSPKWPMAALKAQAIAARTYTIATLGKHKEEGFDLCTTIHCQVYGGAAGEDPATDTAVLETAGEIVVCDGKVINAIYHSSSGGYTEDPVNVWGCAVSYLKPVPDWDQNSPHYQWVRSLEWSVLQAATERNYPQIGALQRVTPATLGANGRVYKVALKGECGEMIITGEQFRNLTGLPSSNMQWSLVYGPEPLITLWWLKDSVYPEALVESAIPGSPFEAISPPWDSPDPWAWLQDKQPFRLIVKGNGWGHRVGLSQWGAKGMAEAGFNEEQILEYYYQGVSIIKIEDLQ
jgi:stage II sporulation protein D